MTIQREVGMQIKRRFRKGTRKMRKAVSGEGMQVRE